MITCRRRNAAPPCRDVPTGPTVWQIHRVRVGALLLAMSFALAIRIPFCTNQLLLSDAADYVHAVQSGFWDTYVDSGSVTFLEMVKLYRDQTGVGRHLWDHLTRINDSAALRHFHVPVSYYAPAIAATHDWPPRAYRVMSAIVAVLTVGLVLIGLTRLGMDLALATMTAVLLGAAPVYVRTTTDLSPHPYFILFACAFLFTASMWAQERRRRYLVAAAVMLALASASLELAPGLIVAVIAATLIAGRAVPVRAPGLGAAVAVFVIALVVLWPGGVLRGGYLKSYTVLVAQAATQRDELYGPLSLLGVYRSLFGADGVWATLLVSRLLTKT